MLKKLFPLLLIASLVLSAAAPSLANDNNLQMSEMEIDIWPEYDQPSTLVIYRISFDSLTSFPTRVSFKIPASAGDPYSVAMKDLDGLLYDLEYSVIPDGKWNRIEFISSSPDIQIEFYDSIQREEDFSHHYSFHWISDYLVKDLKVVVQKPKYASDIQIFPDFGSGAVNLDDNLTYYTAHVGKVNLGETINVSLIYSKANDNLSASTLPVRAENPLTEKFSLNNTFHSLLTAIWENHSLVITGVLLFTGLLLMMIALLLISRRRRSGIQVDAIPEKPQIEENERSVNISSAPEVFCHVCGKKARPGDIYCRACGSKLIQR
jgi:hypothetical protein